MSHENKQLTFIDLFAGCGGLSLGLMQAGWKGLFAVEKSPDAFRTLKENLVAGHVTEGNPLARRGVLFDWPEELGEPSAHLIEDFLVPGPRVKDYERVKQYLETLGLAGHVDLLAGGPPCQGFSSAGRRVENDSRNELYKHYLRFVELVAPTFLLIENVKGISIPFGKNGDDKNGCEKPVPHSEIIRRELEKIDYVTQWFAVKSSRYGVPQLRPRHIMLGVRVNRVGNRGGYPEKEAQNLLTRFGVMLESDDLRYEYITVVLKLTKKNFKEGVTVKQAIGDLSIYSAGLEKYRPGDCDFPGETGNKTPYRDYWQLRYNPSLKGFTKYQKLMRHEIGTKEANSRRVAKHGYKTLGKFKIMQAMADENGPNGEPLLLRARNLSDESREELKARLKEAEMLNGGLKKHAVVILSPDKPAHTLTTLPDDLLHYDEPRILTARECARLQSFPDWFDFKGKYTTGGKRRKEECPRYTQVGNAVPPLLSMYIGRCLKELIKGKDLSR